MTTAGGASSGKAGRRITPADIDKLFESTAQRIESSLFEGGSQSQPVIGLESGGESPVYEGANEPPVHESANETVKTDYETTRQQTNEAQIKEADFANPPAAPNDAGEPPPSANTPHLSPPPTIGTIGTPPKRDNKQRRREHLEGSDQFK